MSTENRFGNKPVVTLANNNDGFGENKFGDMSEKLGSFGAGAAIGAAAVTHSASDLSFSYDKNQDVSLGRSRSEQSFYDRKPQQSSITIGGDSLSYKDLSNAQRTTDGNIRLPDGKTISQSDFLHTKKTFDSLRNSYREDYKKWFDEGLARGYCAGPGSHG